MAIHKDVWKIVNSSNVSVVRDAANNSIIKHSGSFKALPFAKQKTITNAVENEQQKEAYRINPNLLTFDALKKESGKLAPLIVNNYKTDRPITQTVLDAIANTATMSGVRGQDPVTLNTITPNVWITPGQAASIYSQKGIPEIIIKKKSFSILLNGVKIKNPKLSASQIDIVNECAVVRDSLDQKIAESLENSLVYGGSLLFPMFKKDSPVSLGMSTAALVKYGILGKNSIDWMVSLDRWNAVHFPAYDPTAKDFTNPKKYFIPFLGCDVNGERCARIVTAPQPGYWGVLMTFGWGLSDIPGWIASELNYENVMNAIPTMIAQMSIIVRTFNVDAVLATEGMNILADIDSYNTVKMREASVNNPISMDVIGTLQAIQRDFKEVPSLVRLIRQDFSGKAGIPEELILSTEKGAFSSGDTTEGALEKQWESVKYIHKLAAHQLRRIAMLEVINALGADNEIIRALPYTTIEFDNPIVANAEIRSKIAVALGESAFKLVAAGFPADAVAQIVSSYGDEEFSVRSDLLDDLKTRQRELDEREKEKHELEMELLQAQIDGAKAGGMMPGGVKNPSKSEGYTPLEQKKHETTRGAAKRKEGLSKAQNKKIA